MKMKSLIVPVMPVSYRRRILKVVIGVLSSPLIAAMASPTIQSPSEQTEQMKALPSVSLDAFLGSPQERPSSESPGGKEKPAVATGPTLEAVAGAMLKKQLQRVEAEADSLNIFKRLAIAFHSKDYSRVLGIIEGQFPHGVDDPEILNIQGATLAELKRHEEAVALFKKVLELEPKHFWARFNIAEIEMLEGRTASARSKFQAMKPAGDKEDEILDLKIALTYLIEDRRTEAQKVVDAMKFPASSPARYVALAALAFYDGDRSRAHEYLVDSESVFPGQLAGFFLRTLEDAGMSPTVAEVVAVPPSSPLPNIPSDPEATAERPALPLDLRANDMTLGDGM